MSKREKALEFASRVPKPKTKPKDENTSNLQFTADDLVEENAENEELDQELLGDDEQMLRELDEKHL
jgi:hypothetical protein